MSTWLFGASSQWSQQIASTLEGDVIKFGRQEDNFLDIKQVSYHPADIKDWISDNIDLLECPQRVIFNINVGMVQELPQPMIDYDSTDSFQIFNKWWIDNRNQLFFKTFLIDYLITNKKITSIPNHQVCYITSQISADHNPQWNNLQLYKTFRAVDYELIWNQRAKKVNAFGICPAANTRPMEWATFIAQRLQVENLGKTHWLYGVTEEDKKLDFVRWSDWENTIL
tara:strand:+ start:1047 stop:1724 length:678 start_codon:yes stop_codon:yes gene_type:complete